MKYKGVGAKPKRRCLLLAEGQSYTFIKNKNDKPTDENGKPVRHLGVSVASRTTRS